jgi:hypothetical protein
MLSHSQHGSKHNLVSSAARQGQGIEAEHAPATTRTTAARIEKDAPPHPLDPTPPAPTTSITGGVRPGSTVPIGPANEVSNLGAKGSIAHGRDTTWWHRLAHRLQLNRCTPEGRGYRCVGCGAFTRWEGDVTEVLASFARAQAEMRAKTGRAGQRGPRVGG